MAGVAVVTDSTSSLGSDRAGRAGVTVIALQVVIDDVSRAESDTSVTGSVVAEALREGRRVSTSRPTPEAFSAVFDALAEQGYSSVVSAHLSSAMSATCQAAEVSAASAPIPVTVVDTHSLAMAAGFAVLAGAELAKAGADAEEVADMIRRRSAAAETYFYVDTLEYLRRGGRIGLAAAMLGSALAVKPLLRIADGKVQPFERVRTTSKAMARMEELGVLALAKAAGASDQVDVEVHHLDNLECAERLAAQLQGRVSSLGQLAISEVSAVLGVHVGPGTVGLVVSPRV